MADKISKEKRSWNMSRIRGKDTSIEVRVRKRLFKDGFRFRKNVASLPGKPDIVLPKYKTVIFVHGCYWHRHNCKEFHIPKTNSAFWEKKFERNVANDKKHYKDLEELGWNVIIIWECEIENFFEKIVSEVEAKILTQKIRDNRHIKKQSS